MSEKSVKENLKREIGVRSLVLAIINMTVGTGIFVVPAIIGIKMGASAILAYLLCGGLIFLIALCFAELGSKTEISGGTYTYIENAFGPFAGFLANNIYWFGSCVFADAAIANALADTVSYFLPAFSHSFYRILFFIGIFSALAIVNMKSVKNGVRLVEFTAFGKIVPLIIFVLVSSFHILPANLSWTSSPTVNSLGASSLLLFFAFMGLETPLSNGGEIKNPRKTVPRGVFLAILLILILYISIQLIVQGVLGDQLSVYKEAPLAAIAGMVFGKTGSLIIVVVTMISMFGAICSSVLSIPRILFSGARDGLLPKPLSKIHHRFFTPHIAIGVYAFIDLVFAIFGDFGSLATLASAGSLLVYLGIVLATIQLRRKKTTDEKSSFRVPGGVLVPLLASAVIIWLLYSLSKEEIRGIAIFILILSVLYLISRFIKKRKADPTL
jgi:basic amino acid/polyamine antiporter, APA family